jgi:hypothetical protein
VCKKHIINLIRKEGVLSKSDSGIAKLGGGK